MRKILLMPAFFAVSALFSTALNSQDIPAYKNPSLDAERRTEDLLHRMTLEEKVDMLGGYEDFYILPNERLGIPKIKMADGPLGVRNYGEATAFPAPIGVAASFNVELMNEFGVAVGKEARSKGVHIMLSPGVNIYRAPMCGRNFEYLGEDPYLSSRMAAAYVKGVQSQGVVATVKHFAANNQEYDRYNVSSDMDERTLREIYLPAFRGGVVEGGACAVMTSYNLLNGVHCSEHQHLITDILKGEWGFKGILMSDWGSTWDGIAAARAGLDLEMPSGRYMNRQVLLPAIKAGKIKESVIDDKVRRMLSVVFRMGFFDRSQADSSLPLYSPQSRLVALKAAREAVVLLKNKANLLPLDRSKIQSVAVIGPNAHPAVTGGGGSSMVKPFRSVSVLEGMIQTAGSGVKVYYHKGLDKDIENVFNSSEFLSQGEKGLRGEYFSNMNLQGAPALSRIDRNLNFNWRDGPADKFPKTKYSVRWKGSVQVNQDGSYEFIVRGDDGYRLYLDSDVVIDSWKDQSPTTQTALLRLKGGSQHEVVLEYYQNEGGAAISFGWGRNERQVDDAATRLAAKCDAALICVGFNPETEGEGEDREFKLSSEEEKLINGAAKVNPNTIVVLTAGGNVSMTGWIDNVSGLLHTWYPGQEGGTAVAEIIFGDVNPSGKLPASFEKTWEDNACFKSYYDQDTDKHVFYSEGIFTGYRHFDKTGIQPMFPFGFGLSYTSFEYKNLQLSTGKIRPGEKLILSFVVANSGTRPGAEASQLYIRDSESSEPRPVKELKGFAKVFLMPGESKKIELEIDNAALSFYSMKKKAWVAEGGDFEVMIGSSSKDIRLTGKFTLEK